MKGGVEAADCQELWPHALAGRLMTAPLCALPGVALDVSAFIGISDSRITCPQIWAPGVNLWVGYDVFADSYIPLGWAYLEDHHRLRAGAENQAPIPGVLVYRL